MNSQEGFNFNDDEKKEIKEAFEIVDKAHIGKINKHQLQGLIQLLGYNPSDVYFQGKDHSDESQYDFNEVVEMINTKIKPKHQNDLAKFEEEFLDACSVYDPEKTGFITISQMARVLKSFESSSEEQFFEMMRLGERDYGDNIDYKDFCLKMIS